MPIAVTLRHMHYFVAVAEERHFGRAAARLHITQPPLSRQVAELEAMLGVTLLARDPRQVRLTPAGEQVLAEFRTLLAATQAALQRIGALQEALPTLRLGLMNWLDVRRLPAVEHALRRAGLVAGVESELLPGHEALAAVHAGRLHAAVVAAPLDERGVEVVTLARLRMMAVLPARSPLARRRTLALADLNDEPPFYRFRRALAPALWDHFERQYRVHGFVPRQEAPGPEVMLALARIAAGRGCTLMPEPLAVRRYAGVARRPLKERITLDVALVMSPALDAPLREALATAAPALMPPGAERP
jgi:DNA-binding transcriptional LysR family regulator